MGAVVPNTKKITLKNRGNSLYYFVSGTKSQSAFVFHLGLTARDDFPRTA